MLKPMKGSVRLCWNLQCLRWHDCPLSPDLCQSWLEDFGIAPLSNGINHLSTYHAGCFLFHQHFKLPTGHGVGCGCDILQASEGLHRMKRDSFMFRKVIFEPVSQMLVQNRNFRGLYEDKTCQIIQDDKLLFCQGHLCHLSLSMMTWCGYSADSRHSGASPGRGTLHTNPRGRPGHSWPGFGNMWKTRKKMTGWWCNKHLEKWWSSSMGRWQPIYEMENKKCLKPATCSSISHLQGGKKTWSDPQVDACPLAGTARLTLK